MPKVKTSKTKYPDGFEIVKETLELMDDRMRDAEFETHDGKRQAESIWKVFQVHHQRSRYIFDMYYRQKKITREVYEFCLREGYGDAALIAKWKKPGYEKLCCLRCIQTKDHNYSTTCICRVPKSKLVDGNMIECSHCGCRGCASCD